MATTMVQDLQKRIDAAKDAAAKAAESGDVDAELRAMADEDAARAELVTEQAKPRKLAAGRALRKARAAASGAYQVGDFDIAGPLAQVAAEKLPPGGFVIFRSPAADVFKRAKTATAEAGEDKAKETEAMVTFVCECTIGPDEVLSGPGALSYRVFWETVGAVMLTLANTAIQGLGGFQQDAFKRATRAAT